MNKWAWAGISLIGATTLSAIAFFAGKEVARVECAKAWVPVYLPPADTNEIPVSQLTPVPATDVYQTPIQHVQDNWLKPGVDDVELKESSYVKFLGTMSITDAAYLTHSLLYIKKRMAEHYTMKHLQQMRHSYLTVFAAFQYAYDVKMSRDPIQLPSLAETTKDLCEEIISLIPKPEAAFIAAAEAVKNSILRGEDYRIFVSKKTPYSEAV